MISKESLSLQIAMRTATIISVGDEILSGDVVNTNASWLAEKLSGCGVIVRRIIVVPDEVDEIVEAISSCKSDVIILTGGLGLTHDDITRDGVAKFLGKNLTRHLEAEKAIKSRLRGFKNLDLILRMADLPDGCEAILNPQGAAPGFIVEKLIVLPGVPAEMKQMFELISPRLAGEKIEVTWITTKKFESDIVGTLQEAVEKFPEVKIGSYPTIEEKNGKRRYKVKIKLASRDFNMLTDAKNWLEEKISSKIKERKK